MNLNGLRQQPAFLFFAFRAAACMVNRNTAFIGFEESEYFIYGNKTCARNNGQCYNFLYHLNYLIVLKMNVLIFYIGF